MVEMNPFDPRPVFFDAADSVLEDDRDSLRGEPTTEAVTDGGRVVASGENVALGEATHGPWLGAVLHRLDPGPENAPNPAAGFDKHHLAALLLCRDGGHDTGGRRAVYADFGGDRVGGGRTGQRADKDDE